MEELRELKPEEYKLWDKLVMESESGTIFHTTTWLQATGEQYRIYGYFKGDTLYSGIPIIYKQSGLRTSYAYHPPLTPYLGVIFKDGKEKYITELSNKKQVYEEIAGILKKDFDSIYIKFTPYFVDLQPFILEGYSVDVRYTYILNIDNLQEVWNEMSPKRRNNINKAKKEGITVEGGGNFDDIFSMQQKSFERQGKVLGFREVASRYHNILSEKGKCKLFLARNINVEPIAGVYIIWDNKRSYYILGGYDYEKSHHGALVLALWEAIKFTCEKLGLKQFDFEGSMIPAVEKFFRKFGGILTPYYTVTWQNKKFRVINFTGKVTRKLKFERK